MCTDRQTWYTLERKPYKLSLQQLEAEVEACVPEKHRNYPGIRINGQPWETIPTKLVRLPEREVLMKVIVKHWPSNSRQV